MTSRASRLDRIEGLRKLVADLMQKHLYGSAIFFGDKLVTLSEYNHTDVYTLAQAYFLGKQFRRAVHLIRREGYIESSARFKFLAARCLEELKEWEECLILLGHDESLAVDELLDYQDDESHDLKAASGLCLLRGRVFEAIENKSRSLFWYSQALKHDCRCYEAFERIVQSHLLSLQDLKQLLREIEFAPEDLWLKKLYWGMAGIEEKLEDDSAPTDTEQAMASNLDVQAWEAEALYKSGDYERSYEISCRVAESDPFCLQVMPCHLASALELGRKNELFAQAHKLVVDHPHMALSWFAVGCYYMCVGQYDHARRYFFKATNEEPSFLPSWLGFGHAYAALDESDQAMAAYRTINRKFPGCHLGHLCIGVEYQRTNNLPLSFKFLLEAKRMCPGDPTVHHELGVVAYRSQEYEAAVHFFTSALDRVRPNLLHLWDSTLLNLGHALRKLRRFSEAMARYEQCLSVSSTQSADVYSAMGFTADILGQKERAIDLYHISLGIKSNDALVEELLQNALSAMLGNLEF